MGYIKHDAILVTSWHRIELVDASNVAKKLGLQVLGPSEEVTNTTSTFLVCPDGSKEGWEESDEFDAKREKFISYLDGRREVDNSTCLYWVAIAYSPDDASAEITKHAWME